MRLLPFFWPRRLAPSHRNLRVACGDEVAGQGGDQNLNRFHRNTVQAEKLKKSTKEEFLASPTSIQTQEIPPLAYTHNAPGRSRSG